MCKKRLVGVRARGCSGRDRVPDRWAGTPCALRGLTGRAATVFGHREWTGSVSGQGHPGAGRAAAVPVALVHSACLHCPCIPQRSALGKLSAS